MTTTVGPAEETVLDAKDGWRRLSPRMLAVHPVMEFLRYVPLVLAAVHLVVMPQWRYRVHRWEATDTAVYTQTGWLSQERRIAPISRVQTVDSERGPIEQIFRLANVTVTTASAAGALEISGLDKAVARRLVDELTVKADAVEGDAT